MNSLPVGSLLCLVALASIVASAHGHWEAYKQTHGKVYSSRLEDASRQSLYEKTKAMVEKFNTKEAEKAGYTMGLNHMADWTSEERARVNGFRLPAGSLQNSAIAHEHLRSILDSDKPVPDSVDWRKVKGRVGPVANQGNCGSCWAFATAGILEGQEVVHNASKYLISLSEQELLDCPSAEEDRLLGCNGGDMYNGLLFVAKEGGLEDSESYPYSAKDGECKFKKSKVVITDKAPVLLPPNDEENMKKYLSSFGPIAVAISAKGYYFQSYRTGVFHGPCDSEPEDLDHAVLIVGYGTDESFGDYWIVKNSWGESYGEKGYVRMARNKNTCGISLVPVGAVL